MKFPSWSLLRGGIDSFEQDITRKISDSEKELYVGRERLVDRIQKIKADHPLFDELIKRSITFLPTPFNGIAQAIYDSFEGPKRDKYEEVLKFFENIKGQSKEHYEEITSRLGETLGEISNIKSIVAKERTLQDIKDILIGMGSPINQKLESVRNDVRKLWKGSLDFRRLLKTNKTNGIYCIPISS